MLLKNIVSIKGGKRLPKGHMLVSYQNDHPYIRVRDLGKPILEINDSYEYVSANDYPLIKNYTTNHGDILISIVGTIGLVGIVGKTLHNANLTENCVKLSNPKNYLNRYLYYYLISTKGQEQIAQGTVGSTQPKLPIYNIEKINIPEISFNEQQHIVNILGSIDDKIENNEKIIEKLDTLLQLKY